MNILETSDDNVIKPLLESRVSQHRDTHVTNGRITESFKSFIKDHSFSVDPHNELEQLMLQVENKISEQEAKNKRDQISFNTLLFYFANTSDKAYLFIGIITAVICGLGLPSFVFLMGKIVDSFRIGDNPESALDSIKQVSIVLLIIGATIWFVSLVWFSCFIIASESIILKTKAGYLRAILQQDIAWFDKTNVQELSSKLTKECQDIQKAIGEKFGSILMTLSMAISGLGFAFIKGWWFSLLLFCYFPIMFVVTLFTSLAWAAGFTENVKAYGQSAGYAEQAINAIKIVMAFGQEKTEERNYDKFLNRAKAVGIKTHMKAGLAIGGLLLSVNGYYAYSFFVGSYLITDEVWNDNQDKYYSSGDILACFLGVIYGMAYIGMATPIFKALSEGRCSGKMAYDVILRKPQIQIDDPGSEKIQKLEGEIEFKNVSFSYPTRREVKILDNFSMKFEKGKTTAIVGASGSGKSTIVQLIERFYDPDQGTVLIDGQDLKTLNLRDFRQRIGYVGQEPVLFNMSIKENILYGKPHATDEEVIQALKSANAFDFIESKMGSHGIHTNVGNAGGQLSGGQKQRLAIARAFIKRPQILLLDEATSALDKKNEQEVQASIDKIREELGGQITTIVIAHRLSTIKNSDKIIVMKKGKIIEVGNHNTLLQEYPEGIYAKFVKEQESAEESVPNPPGQIPVQDDKEEVQIEEIEEPPSISNNMTKQDELTVYTREHTMKQLKMFRSKFDRAPTKEEEMKIIVDERDKFEDQKAQQYTQAQQSKSQFSRLLTYNRPRFNIFLGLFVSMIQGALMPMMGGLMGKMLFVLMESMTQLREDTNKYCLWMVFIALIGLFSGFFQKLSFGVIGENVTINIRKSLYRNILQKHMGWFDERNNAPSVLTATLSADAAVINGVSTEGLSAIIEAVSAVLTGLAIGFYFSWKMSCVTLGIIPFMALSGYMNAKRNKGFDFQQEGATKNADLLAGDAIMNYKTVASFASEDKIVHDYLEFLKGPQKQAVRRAMLIGLGYGFAQFIVYASEAVLFYIGAQFMVHDGEDPVSMYISIFAIMFAAIQTGQAQQYGPDVGKAKAAAQKIFGILDTPSKISVQKESNHEKEALDIDNFKGEIEFKNVWFRYPTRKNDWVLRGLNLKINSNETVALVGESGCGKSTIVSLILRFYDVDEGEILLDGVNIKSYNLSQLRQAMGLVMQEPTLFNYSIIENILYGKPMALNSDIISASEIANAIEFIKSNHIINSFDDSAENLLKMMDRNQQQLIADLGKKDFMKKRETLMKIVAEEEKKGKFVAVEGAIDIRAQGLKDVTLSNGFKVDCGLRGNKLSGGQKQRIAIARAIIRKPKILILDEATSALDEESQKKVQVALDNIMQDRTSIVIAHRLSTVEKCDRIIVLEGGVLIEEGKFHDLKRKENGHFAQLAIGMMPNNQEPKPE